MIDSYIVNGIRMWLAARKLEAANLNNKERYMSIELLERDISQSLTQDEYPWETITRGFQDRAEKFHKRDPDQEQHNFDAHGVSGYEL